MWKRFSIRRQSVALTWLLSYLAILMVPIMVSLFVYHRSNDTLKSEIHRANDALLKEMKELIDNQLGNVQVLTTELTWNTRIRDLMYSNRFNLEDGAYDLYVTVKEMLQYNASYPWVKNYYVYWAKRDLVLLPGVYRNSRLAYDTIHEYDKIPYELWYEILRGRNEQRFVKLEAKEGMGSALAYIQSFAGDVAEGPPGATVVLLDTEKLLSVIRSVQSFNGGEAMIMDRNNQVLISTGEGSFDPLLLSDLSFTGQTGSFYHEYNGNQSEFMYIKSDYSGLTFVTVIPSSLFWEKAQYVRNITFGGLAFSLAGGFLLTAVLVRKNYGPVRMLTRMLASSPAAGQPGGDEFRYIQNAIADTLNEKEQIQLRMKQQSNQLRSNLLARLLKGKAGGRIPVEESLSAFHIDFISGDFAVILFYLDYETFFEHMKGNDDKLKLIHFIVTNIVEELAGGKHRGFVSEVDDTMACLVNFRPGEREPQLEARELAAQSRQFLREKFRIESTVSISGVKSSPADIPQAYREAVDTMEYMIVIGQEDILACDEIHREEQTPLQTDYYYPLHVEQQLINHIKAGDAEKAEAIIREIIARNVGHQLSTGMIRCLMFNLIGTFMKTINEIGDGKESFLMSNQTGVERLLASESIREMEQQLLQVVREICDYTTDRQKQQQLDSRSQLLQERSGEILAFIEGNYSDVGLNISMIGNHFGMTPTYLSRLFKEQTGSGLLDTINSVRIQRAKALLADQRTNIREAAASVGFHDINTFIRIFKKYEGVTPGQYQKMENRQ
jgi:AraC-like DNA-binding protein